MSAVLHRSLKSDLPTVVGGDGSYLIDSHGKRYLDACGGAAVSCLGHSRADVLSAVTAQMEKIAYAHTSAFTNEPSERLASLLIEKASPGFGAGRAMFLGSGSEAMEAALKLARQYHVERGQSRREKIIGRNMAYHGNTLGALSVGGHAARRKPYTPLLVDVGRVPACYAYRLRRDDESDAEFGSRMADKLEKEILRLGAANVAAFVCEPVSGATLGSVPPAPGYFQRIREICDQYGVLFIADEVMCGVGRTGSFYALEQEGVVADIITVAKGLGAGFMPIAGTLASEKVVDAIRNGSGTLWNGHTYMSHALACAGALAVLEAIEREGLIGKVRQQGEKLSALLARTFGQDAHIGDIRGRGLFWTVEIVADRHTKMPFPASRGLAGRIKSRAQAEGLLVYPSSGCADGVNGDHVLLAPAYIVSDDELETIVAILKRVLDACLAEQI
jgi:adenosylmethionine-8-amino-7-oxononanoate aminotransferase